MSARVHPESLLRVPLVQHMLADRGSRLVARAIDARWHYEGIVPRLGGFNPLEGAVYYAARSFIARWLRNPGGSARRLNENDFLVKEVLFAVHDYLHGWAYRAIETLVPRRTFWTRPVTRAAFEDLVFCHLLSEAVATVGLDYWYLCTLSLNAVCDIGSRTDCGLTTDYHERFTAEYRRYNPELRVQTPEFFELFARFYCSGRFPGFDRRALRESPLVLRWLEHELHYSRLQRRYARLWFAHLASAPLELDRAALDGPCAHDRPWQRGLISRLGALLWDKVKHDVRHQLPALPRRPRRERPRGRPTDYRFTNLNRITGADAGRVTVTDPASEPYRLYQLIARADFARCSPRRRLALATLAHGSAFGEIAARLADAPTVPRCPDEPRDLFLLA